MIQILVKKCVISLHMDEKRMPFVNFKIVNAEKLKPKLFIISNTNDTAVIYKHHNNYKLTIFLILYITIFYMESYISSTTLERWHIESILYCADVSHC